MGSSSGQSSENPHWTSATMRQEWSRMIMARLSAYGLIAKLDISVRAKPRAALIRLREHHPSLGRLTRQNTLARFLGAIKRNAAYRCFRVGRDFVLRFARAV